jgi:hypothetical protein
MQVNAGVCSADWGLTALEIFQAVKTVLLPGPMQIRCAFRQVNKAKHLRVHHQPFDADLDQNASRTHPEGIIHAIDSRPTGRLRGTNIKRLTGWITTHTPSAV